MGKIIDITPGRGSYLEQLALAHTMLDQGKAADCLVFLNNAHCEGTDAEILRGKAFAELHNPTMSNLCNFKAIRNYMRNGGKIRDSFLRPVLFDVIDNCLSLKSTTRRPFIRGSSVIAKRTRKRCCRNSPNSRSRSGSTTCRRTTSRRT